MISTEVGDTDLKQRAIAILIEQWRLQRGRYRVIVLLWFFLIGIKLFIDFLSSESPEQLSSKSTAPESERELEQDLLNINHRRRLHLPHSKS